MKLELEIQEKLAFNLSLMDDKLAKLDRTILKENILSFPVSLIFSTCNLLLLVILLQLKFFILLLHTIVCLLLIEVLQKILLGRMVIVFSPKRILQCILPILEVLLIFLIFFSIFPSMFLQKQELVCQLEK